MSPTSSASQTALELTASEYLHDLRIALISRELDEVEKSWQKAGRAKFCILGAGQEMAQIAAVRYLKNGDWLRSYYRGITEALYCKIATPKQVLAQVLGDSEPGHDPASLGRMMGRHFGSRVVDDNGEIIDLTKQINHASDISPTASQMGPALGLALASRVVAETPELAKAHPTLSQDGQEVAHVCIGDASLAEGIALEAINQAVVQRAPLVISVYDNGYGISVPTDKQFTHASVSKALSGFAPDMAEDGTPTGNGLKIIGPVHDWNYSELIAAYKQAYDWVRHNRNPALVHVRVTQLEGHSSSGDHRRYKSPERLEWETTHDGIACFKAWLVENEIATTEQIEELAQSVRAEIQDCAQDAWQEYYQPMIERAQKLIQLFNKHKSLAPLSKLTDHCAEIEADCDLQTRNYLTMARLFHFARACVQALKKSHSGSEACRAFQNTCRELKRLGKQRFGEQIFAEDKFSANNAPFIRPEYPSKTKLDSGAHIIAAGFATMMSKDPRIVVYGEDVGRLGGVTTCTLGLQSGKAQVEPNIWRKSPALVEYVPEAGFGENRVWDTAIAEGTIVGAAAGMAIRGLRPIAEIQYHDYVNYGAQQLEDEIACLRHRTAGGQEAPCIVRCHGHRLLGMWHSGSPMAQMLRMPGLRVIVPRDAVQAVGMYRAAIAHGRDPVFSVEPLLDLYGRVPVPSNLDKLCIPLGQSERLRTGDDVTIITYGHLCTLALEAGRELAANGIEADIIDLQTLNPLDLNNVARDSMIKTGRVLFVDEDYANGAMGMISKTLLHERRDDQGRPCLWHLESVRVLSSPEHKPAYGADGGFFSKPQSHDIVDEIYSMFDELDSSDRALY